MMFNLTKIYSMWRAFWEHLNSQSILRSSFSPYRTLGERTLEPKLCIWCGQQDSEKHSCYESL